MLVSDLDRSVARTLGVRGLPLVHSLAAKASRELSLFSSDPLDQPWSTRAPPATSSSPRGSVSGNSPDGSGSQMGVVALTGGGQPGSHPRASARTRARACRRPPAAPDSAGAQHRGSSQTGPRDLGREPFRQRMHVLDVLLSYEDECRRLHLAQTLSDVRHERVLIEAVPIGRLQLERVPLHLGNRGPHMGIDLRRCPTRPVHPHAQVDLCRGLRSPRATASSSAAPYARTTSDQLTPGRPASSSTSVRTRSGRATANSSATRPPSEAPTIPAEEMSSSSRRLTTSRAWVKGNLSIRVRPKPAKSQRSRRYPFANEVHWGSHIRLSATPSWRKTIAGPAPLSS